jgi:hypothetical protein
MSGRKKALIALFTVAALAMATGIGWVITRPEERPACCTARATIADPAAGLTYQIPVEWAETDGRQLTGSASTGASTGEQAASGAQVLAFADSAPSEDLVVWTERLAESAAETLYAAVPEQMEILSSESATVSGNEAHQVSWLISHSHYDGPLYGHVIVVRAADGHSSAVLLGMVYPDDPALREEVNWIIDSATLNGN